MWTDKQKEVLDTVEDLLGEHFDSHVVIVRIADVNDKGDDVTGGGYHGGQAMAMGLCVHQLCYLVIKTFKHIWREE